MRTRWEFALSDVGNPEVRGVGEVRLIGLSSAIERERTPRFT